MRYPVGCYFLFFTCLSCNRPEKLSAFSNSKDPAIKIIDGKLIATPDSSGTFTHISTGKTTPTELLAFAGSLQGTPYKYGSTDPQQGFDCSGFITYVFNHFGIAVPRSSVDFTFVHREIELKEAKSGDLILFTGTDSTIRKVGHMGILISLPGEGLKFIHSTSGKANSVTITPLNPYYMGRYMKIVRIFPQNDQ